MRDAVMDTRPVKEYLEETTFHGLGNLVRPSTVGVKLLWMAVLAAAFTYCGIEIFKTLLDYSRKDTTTIIETEKLTDLPSARICQRISDDTGERIQGSLSGAYFKDECDGQLSHSVMGGESLRGFMKYVNLVDYVYGDDAESDIQLDRLYQKTANIQLDETDNLSLESLAIKFGTSLNIFGSQFMRGTCMGQILDSVKAKNFSDTVLASSNVVILDADYVVGQANMSRGSPSEMETDNYGGICKNFNFKNQLVESNGVYEITGQTRITKDQMSMPLQLAGLELQFFLDTSKATDYMNFDPETTKKFNVIIEATATKFTRYSGCSKNTPEDLYEYVNTCRNKVVFKFANCCLCGNISSKCPSAEATCCTELHLAKAAHTTRNNSEFRISWQDCHESIDTWQPCDETKYSASFGFEFRDTLDTAQKFTVRLVIKNTDTILVVKEVPLLTGSAVLGNVGGILGLFVGGSIMSLIQVVVFCLDWFIRLCKKGRVRPT